MSRAPANPKQRSEKHVAADGAEEDGVGFLGRFEGQKYTEIELNLDVLTGKDVSAVKREWARAGNISPLVAVDTDFCVYLAAKAAKLPIEFMENLPAKDYCAIGQEVSNFLLG